MNREKIQQALSGPIASIRTPFNQDGSIDYASLRRIVDFDIQAGSNALLITWGDSLFSILSDQEIADLTKAVVEYSAGRAVVVACTNQWGTPQALAFASFCREVGVDILMVFLPFCYPGCSVPETIVVHHTAIAAQIPVMVNSGELHRTGTSEGLRAVSSIMASVDNVIAMKADVQGQFDCTITSMVTDRWTVFTGGQKSFHMELLPYGCQGYLSTFITFRPEVTRAYWRAISANDIPAAVSIIEKIDRPFFTHILNSTGGFDAALHGIMELSGLAKRWRREPFYSLNDEEMEKLSGFLDSLTKAEKAIA